MEGPSPVFLHSIGPCIASPSLFLALSHLALLVSPKDYTFSTSTNLCTLASGIHVLVVSYAYRDKLSDLGPFVASPIFYFLLGSASFRFHISPDLGVPAHSFDILFGFLFVLHLALVALSAFAFLLLHRRAASHTMLVYALCICLAVILYKDIYSHQTAFYCSVAALVAVLYAPIRATLTCNKRKPWLIALAESAVVLLSLVGAVFCQGGLIGAKLQSRSDAYDFFHGNWHYLIAVASSIVYTRLLQACFNTEAPSVTCVCSMPALDAAGMALLGTYVIVLVLMKEAGAGVDACKATGTTASLAFLLYCVAVFRSAYAAP